VSDVSARRTGYKVSNMLIALGVMLAIILIAVLLVPRRSYDAVKVVDTTGVITGAQRIAPFHVQVPTSLPAGWRPTSARLAAPEREGDPTGMHIGYVTPLDDYAAVEESNEPTRTFVPLMTQHGKLDGVQTVNGVLWDRRFSQERSVRSLVRSIGPATIVVSGNASYDELGVLASSLR
jgi:hypothetical protein